MASYMGRNAPSSFLCGAHPAVDKTDLSAVQNW